LGGRAEVGRGTPYGEVHARIAGPARVDQQHADPAVRIGGLATGHRKIERLTGREFDIPEGSTEVTWFQKEVFRGMRRRYPKGWGEDYQKQAEYEMGAKDRASPSVDVDASSAWGERHHDVRARCLRRTCVRQTQFPPEPRATVVAPRGRAARKRWPASSSIPPDGDYLVTTTWRALLDATPPSAATSPRGWRPSLG
jgi:hypothetical protein